MEVKNSIFEVVLSVFWEIRFPMERMPRNRVNNVFIFSVLGFPAFLESYRPSVPGGNQILVSR